MIDCIQVIVPVKLGWIPHYLCEEGENLRRGDRVSVPLGKKEYVGVVWKTDAQPPATDKTIQKIIAKENLPPISEEELRLWEFVSSYYLCSIGEVYHAAYPSSLTESEKKKSRKKSEELCSPRHQSLNSGQKDALRQILETFEDKSCVLLHCDEGRKEIYLELAKRTLEQGRDVLILSDGKNEVYPGALHYESPTERRELCRTLRESPEGQIVCGGRNSVFLPFRKLGLVIVDNEQSRSYKQELSAPRFNARDTAIMLSSIHGAKVLLGSAVPSLESWHNVKCGKYGLVEVHDSSYSKAVIVDMKAEKKKNGVVGEYYSRILLEKIKEQLDLGGRVLILLPWADTSDAEIEARGLFPKAGARLVFKSISKVSDKELSKFPLTALLRADYLLSKNDFRADEKTMQILGRLCGRCPSLVVQTSRVEHPVFCQDSQFIDRLLEERKQFGAPPFTREIRILLPAPKGESEGTTFFAGRNYYVQSRFLPKTSGLAAAKAAIASGAPARAIIDVDPL